MSDTTPRKHIPRSQLTAIILGVFITGLLVGAWLSYFSFSDSQVAALNAQEMRVYRTLQTSIYVASAAFLVGLFGFLRNKPWVFAGGALFALWFVPSAWGVYPLGAGVILLIVWGVFYVKDNNLSFNMTLDDE